MVEADPRFQEAIRLFNAQEWYAAHDVLEEIWHETADPERRCLQGLLQVAVAQLHLQQDGDPESCTVPVLNPSP